MTWLCTVIHYRWNQIMKMRHDQIWQSKPDGVRRFHCPLQTMIWLGWENLVKNIFIIICKAQSTMWRRSISVRIVST